MRFMDEFTDGSGGPWGRVTNICARGAAAAAVLAVSGAGDVCGGGGAGAGSSSAPVLRLSQNFHPLSKKNYSLPLVES